MNVLIRATTPQNVFRLLFRFGKVVAIDGSGARTTRKAASRLTRAAQGTYGVWVGRGQLSCVRHHEIKIPPCTQFIGIGFCFDAMEGVPSIGVVYRCVFHACIVIIAHTSIMFPPLFARTTTWPAAPPATPHNAQVFFEVRATSTSSRYNNNNSSS